MKKLSVFACVCALTLTFAATSVAEDQGVVVSDEAAAVVDVVEQAVEPCDCYSAPAPCLRGSLFRRPCMPSYAAPCNPCPVIAGPCAPCPRKLFVPCDTAGCFVPPYDSCSGYGCGYGFGNGPVRSLLARLFSGLRGGYAPVCGSGCYTEPGCGYGFHGYGCGCGAVPAVFE